MIELIYPYDVAPTVPAPTADSKIEDPVAGEYFPVVETSGQVIGRSTREYCHSGAKPLHPVIHIHIIDRYGRIYLQKRSMRKDIQPGKWDTAVGGHLDSGEDYLAGAVRELREELGLELPPEALQVLFDSPIRNGIESEDTRVFGVTHGGPFAFQKSEIDDVRFWRFSELRDPANFPLFTPNLVKELERLWEIPEIGKRWAQK